MAIKITNLEYFKLENILEKQLKSLSGGRYIPLPDNLSIPEDTVKQIQNRFQILFQEDSLFLYKPKLSSNNTFNPLYSDLPFAAFTDRMS